jgi:hypothetical protein
MIIGSIWYGPLFGKMYMSAVGMDTWNEDKKAKMKKSMFASYFWQFIASLVMLFVFAGYIGLSGKTSAMGGVENAFWVWIGFIVPLKLGDALWGGNKKLFWLGIGANLVTLLVAGMIIGAWA